MVEWRGNVMVCFIDGFSVSMPRACIFISCMNDSHVGVREYVYGRLIEDDSVGMLWHL